MHITELRLRTPDVPALKGFYSDALGLLLTQDTPSATAFQVGASRVVFEQDEAGRADTYHMAINIPENQFAAAKTWLQERVALIGFQGRDEITWSAWNAHALYFADPGGNVLELIARHNLPNASHGPFRAGSLLEVSEIGLAVTDVPAASGALRRELGLEVWDAGDGQTFMALGDEHGLLIVVRRGRPWFPTADRAASESPVTLALRGSTEKQVTLPGLPYHFRVERAI